MPRSRAIRVSTLPPSPLDTRPEPDRVGPRLSPISTLAHFARIGKPRGHRSHVVVNCARGNDGCKVPPTSEHVMKALEEARKTEEEKKKASAVLTTADQRGAGSTRVGFV